MLYNILTVIFFLIICFYVFMATPFGLWWTMSDLDNGRSCKGMLIIFWTILPELIIGSILGLI